MLLMFQPEVSTQHAGVLPSLRRMTEALLSPRLVDLGHQVQLAWLEHLSRHWPVLPCLPLITVTAGGASSTHESCASGHGHEPQMSRSFAVNPAAL